LVSKLGGHIQSQYIWISNRWSLLRNWLIWFAYLKKIWHSCVKRYLVQIELYRKVWINKHVVAFAFHLNGIWYNFGVSSLVFICFLLIEDGYLVMNLFSSNFFFVLLTTCLIRFIFHKFFTHSMWFILSR
jgi:hypothetical protein